MTEISQVQSQSSISSDLITKVRQDTKEVRDIVDKSVEPKLDTVDLSTEAVSLQYSVSKEYNNVIIKIVDDATKEVVRQIPPEELLRLKKSLGEYLKKSDTSSIESVV